MTEFHEDSTEHETGIPEDVQRIIDAEIALDIDPIREADEDTAEAMEPLVRATREETYRYLREWQKKNPSRRALYPGSGFDMVPKLVLGERNVVPY